MKMFRLNTLLAAILGIFILAGCKSSKGKEQTRIVNKPKAKTQAVNLDQGKSNAADAAQGQSDVPTVTLTEYADFQCPTCKYFSPIVDKLKKTYGDTLNVRYRYFPLSQHRYSRLAARAAQAAKEQGKFWVMHDMLFKNQDNWADARNAQKIFIAYAQKIGLNMKQFKNALNAAKTERIVMQQKKEGEKLGVHATPTFLLMMKK